MNELASLFLEKDPLAAYFSSIAQYAGRPPRRRFLAGQYDPTFHRFMGQVGQQARGGQFPTLSFSDFTRDMDFDRIFREQTRFQRGENEDRFNPRTRFLFGF